MLDKRFTTELHPNCEDQLCTVISAYSISEALVSDSSPDIFPVEPLLGPVVSPFTPSSDQSTALCFSTPSPGPWLPSCPMFPLVPFLREYRVRTQGVTVHACKSSTLEVEAGGGLPVGEQFGMHNMNLKI